MIGDMDFWEIATNLLGITTDIFTTYEYQAINQLISFTRETGITFTLDVSNIMGFLGIEINKEEQEWLSFAWQSLFLKNNNQEVIENVEGNWSGEQVEQFYKLAEEVLKILIECLFSPEQSINVIESLEYIADSGYMQPLEEYEEEYEEEFEEEYEEVEAYF